MPLAVDTLRSHRVGAAVWVLGGSVTMYVMALALAHEMSRFPGGPKALAESVRAGAEAMRPLRWPADRLDTLGGYLTYHNITLFAFFLSVYAAVQGARAVRGAEDRHSLEQVLATGRSRPAVIRDVTTGFGVTMGLIVLGLGFGVAASMAAGGEPDLGGSLITMLASGLCAMVAYALGLLMSQVTATSRTAAGVTSLVLAVLYVGTNVWDEIGPFGAVRFVSPFHYANSSRALVPGYGLDLSSTAVLVAMTAVLLGLATWAFARRDYASTLWSHPRARRAGRAVRPVRVQRPMLGSVWTASLLRGRVGLIAWSAAAAAYSALLASLTPTVMDAWAAFDFFGGVAGGEAGIPPETQYLSLGAEIITPVIAAYLITQAAGWVADLDQGRVEAILATPISWSRLVWERLLAAVAGVFAITAAALGGLAVGAAAVGAGLDWQGLGRTALGCVLLGAAIAALAALVVAMFRTGIAVTVLAAFVGASYLLGLVVALFGWPDWINRLTVFGAFGHPYLEWPPVSGTLVLLALAVGGGLLGAAVAERTPKVT